MLKRRVTDPIRLVMPDDDAIDASQCSYKAFVDAGCDWSKLVVKDGCKPTVFVLQPLTHRQRIALSRFAEGFEQTAFMVRCGLIGLENYEVQRNGKAETLGAPERSRFGDAGEVVTEDWLDKAGFTIGDYAAMALAITAISEVNFPLLGRLGDRAIDTP